MTLLQAHNISLSIGDTTILDSVDLNLEPGELLGLIGPNGAGKSTLLRTLAGLPGRSTGSVMFKGKDLQQMEAQARARNIAYLAQESSVHWPLMVERLVELGRLPHLSGWQQPASGDRRVIKQVMKQTDVEHLRHRVFDTLSGGEAMRVLLARALASEPDVLLADEPVAALDQAHQLDVMILLLKHCDNGGAAVVVLHDLALASHYCHRLQLLDSGRTVAVGTPENVLTSATLKEVYGIALRPEFDSAKQAITLPWELNRKESESI